MERCVHCHHELHHPRELDFPHYSQELDITPLERIVLESHLTLMGNTFYDEAGYSCFDTMTHKLANITSLLDSLRERNII